MNRKIPAIVIIVSCLILAGSATIAASAAPPEPIPWTDKQQYAPGDKGTLYVSYYNNLNVAVQIRNITVIYTDWNAYIGGTWVGNITKTYTNVLIAAGASQTISDITFTVPTDGRAQSTTVSVKVATDQPSNTWQPEGSGFINVYTTPVYMQQIVSLLTVLVVIVIIATIIIAAAIFLSPRRPQMMWRSEQKE